jgi:hypothetical protein
MIKPGMIKSFVASLVIIAAVFFSLSGYVLSQSTEGAPDGGSAVNQPPAVIQGESDAPWYYYWPDENLNPFGMSTLGTEGGGSTFGKSTERPSNLQVNPAMQDLQNQENFDNVTNKVPLEDTLSPQESISISAPSSTGAKKGPIYKWVDENGVIQVTNDLGSVPTKYLDRITTEREEEQEQIE